MFVACMRHEEKATIESTPTKGEAMATTWKAHRWFFHEAARSRTNGALRLSSRFALTFPSVCLLTAIFSSACGLISKSPVFDFPPGAEPASAESKTSTSRDSLQMSDKSPAENVSPKTKGIYHKLKRGETLDLLSQLYKVPVATLIRSNRVSDPAKIRAGTSIFIPTVSDRAIPESAPSGALAWPLRGQITGEFGPRNKWTQHEGIDIYGQAGDEIKAAASGTVAQAGIRGKYGLMAIIDHGDGLATLYGHVRELFVRVGDRVERGEPIAEVGRSGNATGTHLHFEVLRNGRPVNPVGYLQTDAVASAPPPLRGNPTTLAMSAQQPKLEGRRSENPIGTDRLSRRGPYDSGQAANPDFYETSRTTSVHKKPSVSSKKLATIAEGTRVNVVGFIGDWLEIRSRHGKPPGFIQRTDARITR
jgi:murein DD-endopeptidase MepM/ murein hydrolase activator NlpD